jgi:hypothetical protein
MAMLRAAVEELDPSFNRLFIEPCMRAYGSAGAAEVFLEILRTGAASEKAGAASALYWVVALGARDLAADPSCHFLHVRDMHRACVRAPAK